MSEKKVYKLLYVDFDTESLAKLKRIIRTYTLKNDFIIDIVDCANIDEVHERINKEGCDIILLKHGENLPSISELSAVIDVTKVSLFSLVSDGRLEASQHLIDEGANGVLTMSHPNALYKQLMSALYARILQQDYKKARHQIQELEERSEILLSTSVNAIAYSIDGMFVDANKAFLNYFGFDDESDFVGVLLLDLIAKDFLDTFKNQMVEVFKSEKAITFEGHFKHNKKDLLLETEYIARQVHYEGEECLEISINVGESLENTTTHTIKRIVENSKLSFLNSLSHEAGVGSWLLSITIDEYLKIWSYFGIEIYEHYVEGLMNQIRDQFSDLNMVRYTDGSFLIVINDCDITSIDRIGNTIANSVRSYYYPLEDKKMIHSESSFTYATLENAPDAISVSLKKIETQSQLIPRVISDLMTKIPSSIPVTAINHDQFNQVESLGANIPSVHENIKESANVTNRIDETSVDIPTPKSSTKTEEVNSNISPEPKPVSSKSKQMDKPILNVEKLGEFSVLGAALNDGSVILHFSPIADFTSNQERYLAGYDVLDANKNIISWNSAYMFDADNEVSQQLDLLLLHNSLAKLQEPDNENNFIVINLTGSPVKNEAFSKQFFEVCHTYKDEAKRLNFGVNSALFESDSDKMDQFIKKSNELGIKVGIYGLSTPEEIAEIKVHAPRIYFISLNTNLVARLSRLVDERTKEHMYSLFNELKESNTLILAEGVDNPSGMAMVWDYSISLAAGKMLSDPLADLDFDFSQMMM